MNSEQEEHILEKMINTGALQEGHFALSSGLHSGSYLQCALFLMYPDNASLAGSLLGERLAPLKPSFVISPAMGGVIIGHEVARYLGVPFIFCERVKGEMKLRRFPDPGAAPFVIVEDVVTTGRSTFEVMETMRSLSGGEFLGAGCIADRSGGKSLIGKNVASLVRLDLPNFDPAECPFCREGIPLSEPGSRRISA